MRTPRSPGCLGSRRPSLFVPMNTRPPATTGLPYACEPTEETHLMFFLPATSHFTGGVFMFDTMLRSGVPPPISQSPVPGAGALRISGAERKTSRLLFIGSVSPSHCRRKLQREHRRKCPDFPGIQGTHRFVPLAICPARDPIWAKPCLARRFCFRKVRREV